VKLKREELITYFTLRRTGPQRKRKNYGGYTSRYRDRQQGDLIGLLLIFQNKDSGLKITVYR
jgi:hypothetical protein